MSENKTSRYLTYAIGEIFLVVIGILLALQINNWNEKRKSINKSRIYLAEILEDLGTDTIAINKSINFTSEYLKNEIWGLNKTAFKAEYSDSMWTLLGGFYSTLPLSNRTFQKIQNAGDSNLEGYASTYDKISEYYSDVHSGYNRFLDWDRHVILNGQSYLQELEESIEISNFKVMLNGRETSTEKFPVIQDSTEQVEKLRNFLLSPRGRNHLKNNYVRHKRALTVFDNTKAAAINLINEITEILNY